MSSDTTAPSGDSSANPDEVRATPESTREAIVRGTGSGYTVVRHSLVQKYESKKNREGMLAKLVRARKRRELILYLLVLTCWDEDDEHGAWPATVWLRALNVGSGANMTWSRSSLSETWSSLVRLQLVLRNRERRRSRITPLAEVAKAPYTRPDGATVEDHYLILPGAFWTERWFDRLSLSAVAVLLILLKETGKNAEKHLTYAETALWYGIAASTAKKGYTELVDQGLVTYRDEYVKADYAEDGVTVRRFYKLTGDFSTAARERARHEADTGRRKRARKTPASKSKRPRGRAS